MSDLTIQICDFHTPSKSSGKLIDKKSVKKVLASETFKKNLESGRIMGLATHKSRYEDMDPNIPYEDQIMTSPYLENCARKMWIDESTDSLIGDFDLLDTTYGRLTRDNMKKGIRIPVSMSVSATSDDKYYYVEDILGVDRTLRPDLNSKVLKVNFSEKDVDTGEKEYEINGKKFITFSALAQVTSTNKDKDKDEVETCPYCGKTFDECECQPLGSVKSIRKSSIHREYSETGLQKPNVVKPATPKCDVVKAKPVDNREVPSNTEVVTNLDTNVAGVEVNNIANFARSGYSSIIYVTNGDANSYLQNIDDCKNPVWCTTIDKATRYGDKTSKKIAKKLNANILKEVPTVTVEELHKDIPLEYQLTLEEISKLPSVMASAITRTVKSNFSLQQYLTEVNKPPYMVFFRRINEVIQLCRSKGDQEWINKNLKWLQAYFDSYFMTWINQTLLSDTEFNVMMGLRLAKFNVDQKKMRRLNLVMKRVKNILVTTGFITKPLQTELNEAFQDIENDIYVFVTEHIKDYNQKGDCELTFTPQLEITE